MRISHIEQRRKCAKDILKLNLLVLAGAAIVAAENTLGMFNHLWGH